jgi:hypothetical protein
MGWSEGKGMIEGRRRDDRDKECEIVEIVDNM